MKTAVIGSGGREHAIAWALAKSALIDGIICLPGNGGTANEDKCVNIDVRADDFDAIIRVLSGEKPDFAVVGPEAPLAAGLADLLWEKGIPVVGPRAAAARLESSKDFSKAFMNKYGVACAQSESFTDRDEALEYVNQTRPPYVIKADGLAAGKGVVVAPDAETAKKALDDFMLRGVLGEAGKRILIEEYLEGTECSILAAVSVTPKAAVAGKAFIAPFVSARDHKRLLDGAKGPNTGGMGAIAPADGATKAVLERFNETILTPTLRGMIAEGFDYRGFIFFGLMITGGVPKLLEYNARLGDPETQTVLPLADFDFARLCEAVINEELSSFELKWKTGAVCAPVAVSGGYPGEYKKGFPITAPSDARLKDLNAKIFIAGARENGGGTLLTDGGRVLAVSAFGERAEDARRLAYEAIKSVHFEGMTYRRDIGLAGAADSIKTP